MVTQSWDKSIIYPFDSSCVAAIHHVRIDDDDGADTPRETARTLLSTFVVEHLFACGMRQATLKRSFSICVSGPLDIYFGMVCSLNHDNSRLATLRLFEIEVSLANVCN